MAGCRPRAAAYGARLWNHENTVNDTTALLAIQAHASRLRLRGVRASRPTLKFCELQPHLCFGRDTASAPASAEPSFWEEAGFRSGMLSGGTFAAIVLIGGALIYKKLRHGGVKLEGVQRAPLLRANRRDSSYSTYVRMRLLAGSTACGAALPCCFLASPGLSCCAASIHWGAAAQQELHFCLAVVTCRTTSRLTFLFLNMLCVCRAVSLHDVGCGSNLGATRDAHRLRLRATPRVVETRSNKFLFIHCVDTCSLTAHTAGYAVVRGAFLRNRATYLRSEPSQCASPDAVKQEGMLRVE